MANSNVPADYDERVYAGWLGKCIGVRFGAPLENWTYQEIRDNLGELEWYVFGEGGKIFKPDDDTATPMILIRALEDYGPNPTAAQMGDTLLNYIGDQHGTFWWGGYGISTEHTAYLNLASGIPAPLSGSMDLNGATAAEQIGGQIFSDIWGLVAPNNPALAADLAGRAASVTHDGAAVDGGRFIGALVSAAFSERDPEKLIDIGLQHIAPDGEYARVIRAMVQFHTEHPDDWHAAYAHLKANFGTDKYGGVVHIIPNAGIIALGLLYGEGDFSRSIRIANMGGWDTDCNVGNVGAIMGVAVGIDGIDSRWREPINDVLVAASIIGTRNLLTIPQCADLFCRLGRQLAGEPEQPSTPRYHFRYPGSVNTFLVEGEKVTPVHRQEAIVEGEPVLRVAIRKLNKKGEMRIYTRTAYRPSELSANSYGAAFTPLIAPGQTARARVYLPPDAPGSVHAALFVYDDNGSAYHQAAGMLLTPGTWRDLTYTIPPLTDAYLTQIGVLLRVLDPVWEKGSFCIAALDWDGAPNYRTTFAQERHETGAISGWTYLRGYWRLDDKAYEGSGPGDCESYTGDLRWSDYCVTTELVPLLGDQHRLLFRVKGALRSYALGLASGGTLSLFKKNRGWRNVASVPFDWRHGEQYRLSVTACGDEFTASVEGSGNTATLRWRDEDAPYLTGQVGFATGHGGRTRFLSLELSPA